MKTIDMPGPGSPASASHSIRRGKYVPVPPRRWLAPPFVVADRRLRRRRIALPACGNRRAPGACAAQCSASERRLVSPPVSMLRGNSGQGSDDRFEVIENPGPLAAALEGSGAGTARSDWRGNRGFAAALAAEDRLRQCLASRHPSYKGWFNRQLCRTGGHRPVSHAEVRRRRRAGHRGRGCALLIRGKISHHERRPVGHARPAAHALLARAAALPLLSRSQADGRLDQPGDQRYRRHSELCRLRIVGRGNR